MVGHPTSGRAGGYSGDGRRRERAPRAVPELISGRAAVIDFFRDILNEWPDWWTRPTRFTEALPGLVLVEFDAGGTGRTSGVALTSHLIQAWDMRSRPVRVTELHDIDAARREFGLPAEPA